MQSLILELYQAHIDLTSALADSRKPQATDQVRSQILRCIWIENGYSQVTRMILRRFEEQGEPR